VLRMLTMLDAGQRHDLGRALDTPREDEDIYTAADRWLTTLEEMEIVAEKIIQQLEMMLTLLQTLQ
jgi:hypothetical protein